MKMWVNERVPLFESMFQIECDCVVRQQIFTVGVSKKILQQVFSRMTFVGSRLFSDGTLFIGCSF